MNSPLLASLNSDLGQLQTELDGLQNAVVLPAADAGNGHSGGLFMDSLQQALRSVDDKEQLASQRLEAVDSGRSDDLVGAMLSSQEASLSFSMLMQVRNKVMGAMDELIKLPL